MIIYKVTNNINGKIYIGQTTKSLDIGKTYNSLNEADETKYLNKLLKKGNGECVWRKQKWKLI